MHRLAHCTMMEKEHIALLFSGHFSSNLGWIDEPRSLKKHLRLLSQREIRLIEQVHGENESFHYVMRHLRKHTTNHFWVDKDWIKRRYVVLALRERDLMVINLHQRTDSGVALVHKLVFIKCFGSEPWVSYMAWKSSTSWLVFDSSQFFAKAFCKD